jgi:ribosomal protein L40E
MSSKKAKKEIWRCRECGAQNPSDYGKCMHCDGHTVLMSPDAERVLHAFVLRTQDKKTRTVKSPAMNLRNTLPAAGLARVSVVEAALRGDTQPSVKMSRDEAMVVIGAALTATKCRRYQEGLAAAADALRSAEFHLAQSNIDVEGTYARHAVKSGLWNAELRLDVVKLQDTEVKRA